MGTAVADISDELVEGLDRLLECVGAGQVGLDDVAGVRRVYELADLALTRALAASSEGKSFNALGFRDVGDWFAAKTGARRGEGRARCQRAKALDLLPRVDAAVAAGEFGSSHLACLAAAVTKEREALAVRDQHVFVDFAAVLDASQFARVVNRWVALADDELKDPTAGDDAHKSRRLQLSQMLDGTWRINGVLDPTAGETVQAALAAAMKPDIDDLRTPSQRRADALLDVCLESLANTDRPSVGNERPNVHVVFHAADGSAHTTGTGWFLRNWELSQVLCDSTVTAVAATLNGDVFDVGTPMSVIPARNRKAVTIRDRGCRMGGCGQPARFCEIHHIKERENGGTHELSNLVMLCRYHHRELHRRGVKLHWQGVTLIAVHPNGVTIHGPPPPTTRPALS